MMRLAAMLLLTALTCFHAPIVLVGKEGADTAAIPVEDYALYDDVVINKFLTSKTQLVVLERTTVPLPVQNQERPMTIALFQEQEYFHNALPPDLVRDFVVANQVPGRLEGRFQFGVRYRFISGDRIEEPEVALALPVRRDFTAPVQAAGGWDQLAFSRIGRTLRNDQALLYVANMRANGTGAGFLVWFRRLDQALKIFSSEVIWVVRSEGDEDGLMLAP